MEINFDALNIVFKIETLKNSEQKRELLKFSYDFYKAYNYDVETCLIHGWNSYITLSGRTFHFLDLPSEEFLQKVNNLYKHTRRKKMIDDLINNT